MRSNSTARYRSNPRLAAIAFCLCMAVAVQAKDDAGKGLRFSSPQVLDLSVRADKFDGTSVPVAALGASEAARILAGPDKGEEKSSLSFSDDLYGCNPASKACSQQHDRKLIEASGGSVRRDGKRLSVTPAKGAPLVFVDWVDTGSKNADGDEETHWYMGRLDGSGYQRVEVQFGQDAPGDFLINPANGKIAFVHNGADVAEPAQDGKQLVTFNPLNTPLSLRVATLDATGPRVVLQCDVGKDADHVEGHFKGWHDAHSFDIELKIRAEHSKLEHRLALRLVQGGAGWSVTTPDPAQLDPVAFTCKQRKSP